ncbi:MAG: sugar phosphate nucleotidyltransferase [Deltaproteobacteria bacterium]|nr:sugar phosphate nucleotidyltransferase [Deltaproteobacteria bacterium]
MPDAVILCGGRGTRLGALTQETPKPLLLIDNAPFLFHLLSRLHSEGFRRFVLAVHYLAEQFGSFQDRYQKIFPGIQIVLEKEPLGTGGALKNAALHVQSEIFVALNGDSYVPQIFSPILTEHREKKRVFTMVAVQSDGVEGGIRNKGGLELAADGEICRFSGHQSVDENWINSGMYVASRKKILSWPEGRYDLENRLDSLLKPDKAYAFRSLKPLLDIGTPECFTVAQYKLKSFKEKRS